MSHRLPFAGFFTHLIVALWMCTFASASVAQSNTELTDEQALTYIASYPDLISAFGTNVESAKWHYANVGKLEGRKLTFSPAQYIASYPDLITVFGLDFDTATRHYIKNAVKQGRSPSFDGLEYIASNMAVIGTLGRDAEAGARHYITVGYSAGYKTKSFDALAYIASYADLILGFGRSAISGVVHFITNGFAEGRRPTFDATQYISNYSDLKTAFGTNTEAATVHYISQGFAEGRTPVKPNVAPIASISPVEAIYLINSSVTLNGGTSTDADGDRLTYSWSLVSKPVGSVASLGSSTSAIAGLAPDVGGTYIVQLTVNDGKTFGSATAEIKAGTPISGNLSGTITWTKANSPIIQVGRVGIASGATVNIQEGVEYFGAGLPLQVAGNLRITGTKANRVKLNNVDIQPLGSSSANHSVNISFAELQGKLNAASGNANYGNLILTDSKVTLNDFMYIWYPLGTNKIERNYFVSGQIFYGLDGSQNTTLSIINNSFPGGGRGGGAYYGDSISAWNDRESVAVVSKNTFRSTTGVAVSITNAGQMKAGNNYWGTTDPAKIEKMIWDKNTDLTSSGYISYTPFLTAPDLATPTE